MSGFSAWLDQPDTWAAVAKAIGPHDYTYDLGDTSHRLDLVQIVLTVAAQVARAEVDGNGVEQWWDEHPDVVERLAAEIGE